MTSGSARSSDGSRATAGVRRAGSSPRPAPARESARDRHGSGSGPRPIPARPSPRAGLRDASLSAAAIPTGPSAPSGPAGPGADLGRGGAAAGPVPNPDPYRPAPAESASTSLDPRERTSSRRSRGSSDVLASRAASRHTRRRPTMRDDRRSGGAGTTPAAARTAPGTRPADPAAPDSPNAPGDDPSEPSRPAPAPPGPTRITPRRRTRTPSQQPFGRGGPARADHHHNPHAPHPQNHP